MTIRQSIQLGDPVEHRGIVIAPLFPRRDPTAQYLTVDEAIPLGFRVAELDGEASVPQLLVTNPLDSSVLLYDAEELLGAKQNRILNVSVLVGARSETNLDYVSRPEAFARLYPKLLDGYLLDALELPDLAPADETQLDGFLADVAGAPQAGHP